MKYLILFLLFFCKSVFAFDLPSDLKSIHFEMASAGSAVVLSAVPERTVLWADIQVSGNNNNTQGRVFCGSAGVEANEILETHTLPAYFVGFVSFFCSQDITFLTSNVGSNGAHVILDYVDRDVRDVYSDLDIFLAVGFIIALGFGFLIGGRL